MRTTAVLAALVGLALLPGDAAAATRPGIALSAVRAPASPVVAGAVVRIPITVRNTGRRRAKAATVVVFLSRDRRRSTGDRRLGKARFSALRARGRSKRTVAGRLPRGTAAGRWRLLVCISRRCRVARGVLVVVAPRPLVLPSATALPLAAPAPPPPAALGRDTDGDGTPDEQDCAPADPAIRPGAPDAPDLPAARDTNCDGLDGDAARSVFVATDAEPGGLGTRERPFHRVSLGVTAAQDAGGLDILIAGSGPMAETVNVASGIDVFGGYDRDWRRRPELRPVFTGQIAGLFAQDVSGPVLLQNLRFRAPNPGRSLPAGAIRRSRDIVLDRVELHAGPGADAGPAQPSAPGARGSDGGPGANGTCSSQLAQTGGAGGSLGGGRGGVGGRVALGLAGRPGSPGAGGALGGPGGEPGQPGGAGSSGDAGARRGLDGGGGTGWRLPFSDIPMFSVGGGQGGTAGSSGTGGGGGGGGGGDADGTGGSGGGGGGGGTGGPGGRGGPGGESSIALLVEESSGIVLRDVSAQAQDGGNGGTGAAGGAGGAGGLPGARSDGCAGQTGGGGRGGAGGGGQNGGHGGGGAGGWSAGLLLIRSQVQRERVEPFAGLAGQGGQSPSGATGQPGRADGVVTIG